MSVQLNCYEPAIQRLVSWGERAKKIPNLFEKAAETQNICIQLASKNCYALAIDLAEKNLSEDAQLRATVLKAIHGCAVLNKDKPLGCDSDSESF